MIDQEVADALYTSSKKGGDHRMNTDIKDRIREYDVSTISRFMFDVMTAFQGEAELEGLVGQCLSVIGQWIGMTPSSSLRCLHEFDLSISRPYWTSYSSLGDARQHRDQEDAFR